MEQNIISKTNSNMASTAGRVSSSTTPQGRVEDEWRTVSTCHGDIIDDRRIQRAHPTLCAVVFREEREHGGGGAEGEGRRDLSIFPLHVAAFRGSRDVCVFLLAAEMERKKKGDGRDRLHTVDERGCTPLMVAAEYGHTDICQLFLEAGASPTSPRNDGASPLCVASERGHLEVCKLLLVRLRGPAAPFASAAAAAAADVNASDLRGRTPLMLAASAGHTDVCALLLAAGADSDSPDAEGITPLFAACQEDRLDVCRLLLARGAGGEGGGEASLNLGWSPLLWAAQAGNQELCSMFITQYGADPEASKHQSRFMTPSWVSLIRGWKKLGARGSSGCPGAGARVHPNSSPNLHPSPSLSPDAKNTNQNREEEEKVGKGGGASDDHPSSFVEAVSQGWDEIAEFLEDFAILNLSMERRRLIRGSRGVLPPAHFICEVSGQILVDPVLVGDGDVRAERFFVEKNVCLVGTDPVSGRPTTLSELRGDMELWLEIRKWGCSAT